MPRVTTDELVGYKFDVMAGERQVVDNGMPVFNGSGEPKVEATWVFQYTGIGPSGDVHRVITPPMNKVDRDKLVAALTGVMPVSSIDLPAGVTV